MGKTQTIKLKKTTWLNIVNPKPAEIKQILKKFKFNELDLEDTSPNIKAQRPKINFRKNYFFMVLLFPRYNKKNKEITPAEIDIFITKGHLITINNNHTPALKQLTERYSKNKQKHSNKKPDEIFYEILDYLYNAMFPMVDHISLDINKVEKSIFTGQQRESVNSILIVKRNIVNFKRTMQVHKSILRKLLSQNLNYFNSNNKLTIYYNDLIDYTKNIWDILENHQQSINALEDTNDIKVTFRTNDIIKTLTLFSVIMLPLTFIAAIFTMDTNIMPIRDTYLDWYKIIGIMITVVAVMIIFFKRKKWL